MPHQLVLHGLDMPPAWTAYIHIYGCDSNVLTVDNEFMNTFLAYFEQWAS